MSGDCDFCGSYDHVEQDCPDGCEDCHAARAEVCRFCLGAKDAQIASLQRQLAEARGVVERLKDKALYALVRLDHLCCVHVAGDGLSPEGAKAGREFVSREGGSVGVWADVAQALRELAAQAANTSTGGSDMTPP